MGNGNDRFPTGSQGVPNDKPTRNPNDPTGYWKHRHFFFCVVEGLRKAYFKPLNCSQLSLVTQGLEEPPLAFL
jgi:hypothetical protein